MDQFTGVRQQEESGGVLVQSAQEGWTGGLRESQRAGIGRKTEDPRGRGADRPAGFVIEREDSSGMFRALPVDAHAGGQGAMGGIPNCNAIHGDASCAQPRTSFTAAATARSAEELVETERSGVVGHGAHRRPL